MSGFVIMFRDRSRCVELQHKRRPKRQIDHASERATLVGLAAEAEQLAPVVGCRTANWPELSGAGCRAGQPSVTSKGSSGWLWQMYVARSPNGRTRTCA